MLKINQKPVWHRKRTTLEETNIYAAPEKKYLNLLPAVAESDVIGFGQSYVERARFNVSSEQAYIYSVGDLIYEQCPVYVDEYDLGNASHVVTAILTTVNVTRVECKRLAGVVI